MQTSKHYIVEHMEEYLFDWSFHEIMQMLKYLNKKSTLWVSNYKAIQNYKGKDAEKNDQNQQQLAEYLATTQTAIKRLPEGIHNYKVNETLQLDGMLVPLSRVCLLDMRGQKLLTPEDAGQFDVFVFGGILGDHPPRDRTKALRSDDIQMRHLGTLQFSTDTAVLVTKLIIEKQLPFEKIQFVDEPEMQGKSEEGIDSAVQMEGFRYVTSNYNPMTEQFEEPKTQSPLMAAFIKEKLMFDDFDLGEMILEPQ